MATISHPPFSYFVFVFIIFVNFFLVQDTKLFHKRFKCRLSVTSIARSLVVYMEELLDRITVDPDVLVGKPVIRGTRIPVYLIVELVANGLTI